MGIFSKWLGNKSKEKAHDNNKTNKDTKTPPIVSAEHDNVANPQAPQTTPQTLDIDAQLAEIAQINDIDTLKALVKQYKGKQKKLYRTSKDRLDALKARQQRFLALEAQFETLNQAATAQTLSMTAVLQAEKQLNALDTDFPSEVTEHYQETLERLRDDAKATENAKNARQQVLSELSRTHDGLKSGEFSGSRTDFNTQMNGYQQAWLQLPDWQSAEAKGMDIRFEQLLSQTNNMASQHFDEQKHKHAQGKILVQCQRWLNNNTFVTADMLIDQEKRWQSLSPLYEPAEQKNAQGQFDRLMTQLREKSTKQISAQHDNDGIVPNLLDEFAEALENGQVKQSQQLQTHIRERINSDAGLSKSVYKSISGRFKRLENRLGELKQWQHFGDDHVRQDLINAMQKLVDDDRMDIVDKADQIKSLQAQWKALKGRAPQALWKQFKQLGDIAWQPCAVHFKAERNASKDLLKQRLDFLAEAQRHLDAVDWDKPNWKAFGEAHKQFEHLWREFPKLQDKEYRKAKKAYDTVVKQWDAHMDAERQREKVRREGLIEQANAQLGAEDTAAATDVIKILQGQWSPTLGLKKHRDEQALWETFKTACDAVFAEHHQQRNKSRQALNAAYDDHQARLNEIAALFDQDNDFDTFKIQFHDAVQALPDFDDVPDKAQRSLRAQLNQLTTRFDKRQHEVLMDKHLDYLTQLNDQDRLCTELECDTVSDERLQSISAQWQSIAPLFNDGQSAMRKRFEQALKAQEEGTRPAADDDVVAEVQTLCLSLELTADLPSPDFAQPAREQLRLKILDDAMNGDKSFERYTTEAGLFDITLRWHTLPKGALNDENSGDSLANWRTRFANSVETIRRNNQLKPVNHNEHINTMTEETHHDE